MCRAGSPLEAGPARAVGSFNQRGLSLSPPPLTPCPLSPFSAASPRQDKRRRPRRAEGSGSTPGSRLGSSGGPRRLPAGNVLLSVAPAAAGLRSGSGAGLELLRLAECAALTPPLELFPGGEEEGFLTRRRSVFRGSRLSYCGGFVPGKSAWEQLSVWPVAGRCPSPITHVALSPVLAHSCPDWPLQRPRCLGLGLNNTEGGM